MKRFQHAHLLALSLAALSACTTISHSVEHAPSESGLIPILQGPISTPHETIADVIVETSCTTLLPLTAAPRNGLAALNTADPRSEERAVIDALRAEARALGADALLHTKVSYETYFRLLPLVSLVDFCWMTASSTAVRFTAARDVQPATPPPPPRFAP